MSQQEMAPEPQQPLDASNHREYQEQFYYRTPKRTGSNVPKEEPAIYYDEPQRDYSYTEGYRAHVHDQSSPGSSAQQERTYDGRRTAEPYRYSSYQRTSSQQWQVPLWARPQVHAPRRLARVLLFLVLGILLIKPLLILLGVLLGLIVATIGLAILLIILPLLLVLMVIGTIWLMFRLSVVHARPRRHWPHGPFWW